MGSGFQLGDAQGKAIRRREQVVEVDRQPVRAFDERAVQVELERADAEHDLLAEPVVEARRSSGWARSPSSAATSTSDAPGELRAGNEEIDVAEHPLARIVVGGVREARHPSAPATRSGLVERARSRRARAAPRATSA